LYGRQIKKASLRWIIYEHARTTPLLCVASSDSSMLQQGPRTAIETATQKRYNWLTTQ